MRRPLGRKLSVAAVLFATLAACAPRARAPSLQAAPTAPGAAASSGASGTSDTSRASGSSSAGSSSASGASGAAAAQPEAPAGAAPVVAKDSFAQGVAQIKNRVPEWDNGTGIAIRFVQIQTGKRLTFLYVDRTPPDWKAKLKTWLILSTATWDGEIVSTVAITLSALKAGRYEGADSKSDCMIGAAIGTDRWDPKDPSSAWSNNEGGFCEVELREGTRPGHLEGQFKAKLVSSEGVYYTIDEGYLYINR